MSFWGRKNKKNKTSKEVKGITYPTIGFVKPKTWDKFTSLNEVSLLFFDREDLTKIFEMNKKAKDAEFQVHYRACVFECTSPFGIVYVTIPTVFYNFKQEFSHAAIDYQLSDIETEAAKHIDESLHIIRNDSNIKIILQVLRTALPNTTVKILEVSDMSIHRHPGKIKFSSTDLDDSLTTPGIIYRKGSGSLLQTDSIIINDDKILFWSESRYKNIIPSEDIRESRKIPTLTFVSGEEKVVEKNRFIEFLNGNFSGSNTEVIDTSYVVKDIDNPAIFIEELGTKLSKLKTQKAFYIDENNLVERTYNYTQKGWGGYVNYGNYSQSNYKECDYGVVEEDITLYVTIETAENLKKIFKGRYGLQCVGKTVSVKPWYKAYFLNAVKKEATELYAEIEKAWEIATKVEEEESTDYVLLDSTKELIKLFKEDPKVTFTKSEDTLKLPLSYVESFLEVCQLKLTNDQYEKICNEINEWLEDEEGIIDYNDSYYADNNTLGYSIGEEND